MLKIVLERYMLKFFFSFRDSVSPHVIVPKLRILLPAKCWDYRHVGAHVALETEVFPVAHLIPHDLEGRLLSVSILLCPGSPIAYSGLLALLGCFQPVLPLESWLHLFSLLELFFPQISICLLFSFTSDLCSNLSHSPLAILSNILHDKFFFPLLPTLLNFAI